MLYRSRSERWCGSIDDLRDFNAIARVKFVEKGRDAKRAPFPRYDQDTRGWNVRCNENRLVPRETNYAREWHVPCIRLHFRGARTKRAWITRHDEKRERVSLPPTTLSQSLYANFNCQPSDAPQTARLDKFSRDIGIFMNP